MYRPFEATSDAILEAVSDAIISCDIDGIIDSWNRGAEDLYGYTALEAIGSPLDIITPPDTSSSLNAGTDEDIYGQSSGIIESQRLTKSFQTVDVAISESPIYGPAGNLIGHRVCVL